MQVPRDGLTAASRAAAGHLDKNTPHFLNRRRQRNEPTFRADRTVAVLGLEHFAGMNAAAGRDRPHWDAALASINFAAHALASS
jgi:hypothetical protein